MEEPPRNNSNPSESSPINQNLSFFSKFSLLIAIISLFVGLFTIVLIALFWSPILEILLNFFNTFENCSIILSIYYNKIIYLLYHPGFVELAVIFAFFLGIVYLLVSIENRGHMIMDSEDYTAHQLQSVLLALGVFNTVFLFIYVYYLYSQVQEPYEALIVFLFYIINFIFVILFSFFAQLMHNYSRLDEFCQTLKEMKKPPIPLDGKSYLLFLILYKKHFRNILILIMILSLIISYILNYNLLTLIYVELLLLVWIFIILSLSFPRGPIKGPVNIYFNNGQTRFSSVFIIEESPKGYINTLHSDNSIKTVMTSTIQYIEAA